MIKFATETAEGAKGAMKAKEAVLVLAILAMGGAALAWGASQSAPSKSSELSPDEQCRSLVNGILGADSGVLLRYMKDSDKQAMRMTDLDMRILHEKVITPRFVLPFAWRPREGRVLACGGPRGVIALTLGHHSGPERIYMKLNVQNDGGRINYRYHDLLLMAASLDRAAKLKDEALDQRTKQDAQALIKTDLPGFDTLHPSARARKIFSNERAAHARHMADIDKRNPMETSPAAAREVQASTGRKQFRMLTPLAVPISNPE